MLEPMKRWHLGGAIDLVAGYQRMQSMMISRPKCRYLNSVSRVLEDVMIGSEDESDQCKTPVTPQVVVPEPDHGKGEEREG